MNEIKELEEAKELTNFFDMSESLYTNSLRVLTSKVIHTPAELTLYIKERNSRAEIIHKFSEEL